MDTQGILERKRVPLSRQITAYGRGQIANDIVLAAAQGRLLSLDKKRSQDITAGVPGANSLVAIQDSDFENNIANFWGGVKWKQSGGFDTTKTETETAMAAAWRKAQEEKAAREADGKASKKGRAQLDEYINKYGAIPKGERPTRDIQMPKRTSKDKKLSQTVRTVMEAGATPEDILTAEEAFFYDENTQLEGPEVDSEAFLYGLFNPDS
jgi:hypothetical protein